MASFARLIRLTVGAWAFLLVISVAATVQRPAD